MSSCSTTNSPETQPPTVSSRVNPGSKPGEYIVHLDARSEWFNTGIKVKPGMVLDFSARGQWGESPGVSRSANGGQAGMFGSGYWGLHPVVSAPWGALVGKIGMQTFPIGSLTTYQVTGQGILQIAINDALGQYHDNHGRMVVTINAR